MKGEDLDVGTRKNVSSIWNLINGAFQPVDWSAACRSTLCEEIVGVLKGCATHGAPLLLRGSILEQRSPHPKADIDLLLVAPPAARVDLAPLQKFGRFVDICRITPDGGCSVLMALATTRSLQVCGEPFPQKVVPLTRDLIVSHWLRYAPFEFSPQLRTGDRWFLPRVKQLLRSVALIRLMDYGQYSRDLPVCQEWLQEYDGEIGRVGARFLEALGSSADTLIDVANLQSWLRHSFYSKMEKWKHDR